MKKKVFFFLLFSGFLTAQISKDHQQLLWLRFFQKTKFNENWQLKSEIENRDYINPRREHQLVVRFVLDRKIHKNLSATLGFAYFKQYLPHHPEIESNNNTNEYRPQFEFIYHKDIIQKLDFTLRSRNDFRFIENQKTKDLEFSAFRLRLLVELSYEIYPKLQLKVFDELMFNTFYLSNLQTFDQNRYGFGIKYKISNSFATELGYLNWFQPKNQPNSYFDRDIIRFTLYHDLKLKK
jgi:hypothetical protein